MISSRMSSEQGKPPYPPFTEETARIKVKAAQDAWNTKSVTEATLKCPTEAYTYERIPRDPHKVKLAYTEDSIWRNRDQFLTGRDAIADFLTQKWQKENGYRLRKELFAFKDNKM